MKHYRLDSTSTLTDPFINREQTALDVQEQQFLEKCRRSNNCVHYPHHIPTPFAVTVGQRRGLSYQATAGNQRCMVLPVVRSALTLTETTCSLTHPLTADKALNGNCLA